MMSTRGTQEVEPEPLATSVEEPLLCNPLDDQRRGSEAPPGIDLFRLSTQRQAWNINTAMNIGFTATGNGLATQLHEPLPLANGKSSTYPAALNADTLHAHQGQLCHGQSSMILGNAEAEAEAEAEPHTGACPVHSGLMACPFHPPSQGVPETALHGTLSEHSVQRSLPNPADHWDVEGFCDNSHTVAREAAQFLSQARKLDSSAASPRLAGAGGQFKPRKHAAEYKQELNIHEEDDVEVVVGVAVDAVVVSRPP